MKVAVIGLRGAPHVIGGVESHCERLYPALARTMPESEFWLLTRRQFATDGEETLAPARVKPLWAPKATAWEAVAHTIWALIYARFQLGARVAHIHGIGPGFFAPLARVLGMRLVVTHHAADFSRPKWGPLARSFLLAGEGLVARMAHHIICVSGALQAEFLERHPRAKSRTSTITHGVTLDGDAGQGTEVLDALGIKPGGYVIAVGRLDETKRFHDLVTASNMAGTAAKPLVIIGSSVDGVAYADALRASAGPRIIFAGYRYGHELASLYRHAALLIHPSEMEGFGLVILEALSSGISVLASDISPHREFGLPDDAYFPVGDIDHIARALIAPDTFGSGRSTAETIRSRYDPCIAVHAHAQIFAQIA